MKLKKIVLNARKTDQFLKKYFKKQQNSLLLEPMKYGVLLPVHHGLTEEMFKRLHSTIEEFINKFV